MIDIVCAWTTYTTRKRARSIPRAMRKKEEVGGKPTQSAREHAVVNDEEENI